MLVGCAWAPRPAWTQASGSPTWVRQRPGAGLRPRPLPSRLRCAEACLAAPACALPETGVGCDGPPVLGARSAAPHPAGQSAVELLREKALAWWESNSWCEGV